LDITAYIRELLFGHDCVIVPGFGGFIGNYTPARIDKSSGTFYPPVKLISFNRNLNHNDGLLVGRISGSAGMNYGDARTLVENYVAELKKKLEKGEKVVFDNIGSFVNNQEGNVQFEPDRKANYHLDSYGLESFQCLPLEGYDVRKRVIKHIGKDPVRQASMRKILWRAAVILPLLSILVAVSLKTEIFKSKIEATTMNPLVSAEFEYNKKAVDEDIKETEAKVLPIDTLNPEVPVTPVIELPAPIESDTYFLITGSFREEENAVTQVNMLKTEGFTPESVHASNGFYRVSAIISSDLKTAMARKDSLIEKFPGAWVSKKK
jgi:nucleoid DNA-binding protein